MKNIEIKQFRTGGLANFSYFIGCTETKQSAIIDTPSGTAALLFEYIKENNFTLNYIINTHNHHDHIPENVLIKENTNAQIIMHPLDNSSYGKADIDAIDDDIIPVGNLRLKVLHTPGHTPGGISLYVKEHLFTGDSLFVGDSGRTDLPGGNRAELGASIRKMMCLPGNTVVCPGHDYGPTPMSTLAWEKENNVNAIEYGFSS